MAYNFPNIIITLFENSCPLYKVKGNKYDKKPWLTKGIQKAYKKKNKLYKDFLKNRTQEAEQTYKTYKNRLISMMRSIKRNYYSKVLEGNNSNIKSTWQVLDQIIKEGSSSSFPKTF